MSEMWTIVVEFGPAIPLVYHTAVLLRRFEPPNLVVGNQILRLTSLLSFHLVNVVMSLPRLPGGFW